MTSRASPSWFHTAWLLGAAGAAAADHPPKSVLACSFGGEPLACPAGHVIGDILAAQFGEFTSGSGCDFRRDSLARIQWCQ